MSSHRYQDLIFLFNSLFQHTEKTVLIAGGIEPLYLPKDADFPLHRIIFTQDYYASALHEIAHWCIAGEARRQHIDYGYWYQPDGRDAKKQRQFEQVEIKPQALECIFSMAAGVKFSVSLDNLSGENTADTAFTQQVYEQVRTYLVHGLPSRAAQFTLKLLTLYSRRMEDINL